MPGWRRFIPALPYPHFMAFAPLDTWARLLFGGSARGGPPRISARYWLRIAAGLCTSTIGTLVTLPERLVMGPVLASGFRAAKAAERGPRVVCVLGYYRSGTTHLHYLLACDPQFATARWYHVLAPQGFVLSWTFLRYFLVPFLSSKRPQDDVAYGPEYPSEDDFAVCNWSLCGTMPGRMVLPREWDGARGWARWNDLRGLSEGERARFDRAQWGFAWKLGAAARGAARIVLFKTPSHTARVRRLHELFGGNVRFVHISRDAAAVVRSNVAMHARFEPFLLQEHPGDEVIRERVVAEYDATERAFLEESAALPAGRCARMRYEDLIADPIAQVRRVYTELGLELSGAAEARMRHYLASVRDYRAGGAATSGAGARPANDAAPERLAWMHGAFGHDAPPTPAGEPVSAGPAIRRAKVRGYWSAFAVAVMCAALWPSLAYVASNRHDWLIWPVGVAIGLAGLRAGGRGSLGLGVWAAVLVLLVFAARAWPATYLSEVRYHHPSPGHWHHVWLSTKAGALAMNNLWWVGLGMMTAYRFATRQHVRPPGM